ncbi:uncharacterized protein BT62DRAFT_998327, partial [Guyanagaster necrorhizus]
MSLSTIHEFFLFAQPDPMLVIVIYSVGAFEIAVTIASLLFGGEPALRLFSLMLWVQFWKYANGYQRDPWYIKAIVATVFSGNLFHQVCLNHSLYTYTVTHWGDVDVLLSIPWSFLGLVTASGCVAFVVQSFYVYRIWKLSNGSYLLIFPLAAISMAEFIVNMYAVDAGRRITVYTEQVKIKDKYHDYSSGFACILIMQHGSTADNYHTVHLGQDYDRPPIL